MEYLVPSTEYVSRVWSQWQLWAFERVNSPHLGLLARKGTGTSLRAGAYPHRSSPPVHELFQGGCACTCALWENKTEAERKKGKRLPIRINRGKHLLGPVLRAAHEVAVTSDNRLTDFYQIL